MYRKPLALLAIAALVLAGCAHRERAAAPPTPTTTNASTTTSVATPPSTRVPPTGRPSPVLSDGRYAAFLTAIDVPRRTVTFDVIQWFSGAAAEEAYHQDHPETGGGPPDGFYIRNTSPKLRTLPVRRNVPVQVIWLTPGAGSEPTTFEALPAYFTGDAVPDDRYVWYDPFWLTVHSGYIESITEQYLP